MSKRTNNTLKRTTGTSEFDENECPVERVGGCYPNRCFMRESVGCKVTEKQAKEKRDKRYSAIIEAFDKVVDE